MDVFSGPMFEAAENEDFRSDLGKRGGHYNVFHVKPGRGLDVIKEWFPEGEANDLNVALFSTSGVHGTYTTIEEVEGGLQKHGETIQSSATMVG